MPPLHLITAVIPIATISGVAASVVVLNLNSVIMIRMDKNVMMCEFLNSTTRS
jgi:hypothetical protein